MLRGSDFRSDAEYNCYSEFAQSFQSWCDSNCHPMAKRNSAKSSLNDANFQYKSVKFYCKHAGQVRSKGENIRTKQRFNALGCNVVVNVNLIQNPYRYRIGAVVDVHSHQISRELYCQYPQNRVLSAKEKREFSSLLNYNSIPLILKLLFYTKLVKHCLRMCIISKKTCVRPPLMLARNRSY